LADQAFTHEEAYCSTLLQAESREKLMSRVEKELISIRKQQIMDKDTSCRYMIENRRNDELMLLYKCFAREESNLGVIIHCLQEYIESQGTRFIQD
jgi:hypothetical protein